MKFMRFYVESDEGKRVKCDYSYGKTPDGREYITIYAKEYGPQLRFLPACENNTDTMTDYFEKDRVRVYESDGLYPEVKARFDLNYAADKARLEKKVQKRK
jgi:hypothetical protein